MIDVHTHVVPDVGGAVFRIETGGEGERGVLHMGSRPGRPVPAACWSLDTRRQAMEAAGVDIQVLSPLPDLLAYDVPAATARDHCRRLNEWLAAAVAADERFAAFGALPMQEPDLACEALAEVRQLGLDGVELGSNVDGVALHDDRFDPVFAEVERLGLAVLVHAVRGCGADAFSGPAAANGVTFPNEVGYAVGGLIAEGVLSRRRELRLCASHGGGSLAVIVARLDALWGLDAALQERVSEQPSLVARRLFVDPLVVSEAILTLVTETFGAVVAGSDYPIAPYPIIGLRGVDDEPERYAAWDANARRLLALDRGANDG